MRLERVLADDLTGACDVGGELLCLGRPVRIRSAIGDAVAPRNDGVLWVENTQSRACEPAEAARRVRLAAGPQPLGRGEVAFKKIDTALRGHVAVEVAAAVEVLRPDLVLVAPAIPEVHRTTEGGRQLIGGVPVSETAFGRDPVNPVRDASVVTALESQGGLRVRAVPLATVRDRGRYDALVRDALAASRPVLVADAVSDADLTSSVEAVVREAVSVLVVGSIGVARALAAVVRPVGDGGAAPAPERPVAAGRGVLVVCGSLHPVARRQLAAVERRWGIAACEVGADPDESGRMVGTIVTGSGLGVLASRLGASDPQSLGESIGRAARVAVEIQAPSGLVLIGGETAYHCLRALGDPALEVESRPMPLVVRTRMASGGWCGMRVISKGGSAGDDDGVNAMVALAEDGQWGCDDR